MRVVCASLYVPLLLMIYLPFLAAASRTSPRHGSLLSCASPLFLSYRPHLTPRPHSLHLRAPRPSSSSPSSSGPCPAPWPAGSCPTPPRTWSARRRWRSAASSPGQRTPRRGVVACGGAVVAFERGGGGMLSLSPAWLQRGAAQRNLMVPPAATRQPPARNPPPHTPAPLFFTLASSGVLRRGVRPVPHGHGGDPARRRVHGRDAQRAAAAHQGAWKSREGGGGCWERAAAALGSCFGVSSMQRAANLACLCLVSFHTPVFVFPGAQMCGFGHCFRTEAGAAGAATRGLYRLHQFSKARRGSRERDDTCRAPPHTLHPPFFLTPLQSRTYKPPSARQSITLHR